MKKIIINLTILVFIFQIVLSSGVEAKVDFSPEFFQKLAENKNKVPHIDIPAFKRVELENGLVIYFAEEHKLPLIFLGGYIEGGRVQEDKNLAGITDFMVSMMNTGTANFGEQELDKYKEKNAISFGIGANDESFDFGGNALISDKEKLISLAAETLIRPKFDTDYFKRIKNEYQKSLTQAKTKENSLLNMYFWKNIYNNHPYAYSIDYDLQLSTLDSITPETLTNYYQQTIVPNHTILFVYGDVDSDNLEQMIIKYFGNWTKTEVKLKEPKIKVDKSNYGKIILVNKPDATQAKIKMGYNFFDDKFEEKVAFGIANQVYGGGDFESRLMEELRSDKGYVYNISSSYYLNSLGGAYVVNTNVKPEKTYATIEKIKEVMLQIKTGKEPITTDEVFKIINRRNAYYPKSYKYDNDVLGEVIGDMEIMDRGINHINDYVKEYNSITAVKAQETFAKYTYPDRFLTVIVANKEDVLPQFKEAGIDVQVIELN